MTENYQFFFFVKNYSHFGNIFPINKAKLNHKMGYKTNLGYWNFPKLKLHATSLKEITCKISITLNSFI